MESTQIKKLRELCKRYDVHKAVFYIYDKEYLYREVNETTYQFNHKGQEPTYYEDENGNTESKTK